MFNINYLTVFIIGVIVGMSIIIKKTYDVPHAVCYKQCQVIAKSIGLADYNKAGEFKFKDDNLNYLFITDINKWKQNEQSNVRH